MTTPPVALRDLSIVFIRLGATSFGGSMLPLMEEALAHRRRWITPEQFVEAVALAELVPGPIALKVAAYAGHRLRGWKGSCAAVTCFCLPSFLLVVGAGFLLFHHKTRFPFSKLTLWVTPIVMGLFLATAWRLGRRCLRRPAHWAVALLTFIALMGKWSPLFVLWGCGLLRVAWHGLRRQFS